MQTQATSTPSVKFNPTQQELPLGLLSFCKECSKEIPSLVYRKADKLFWQKNCPIHGVKEEALCDSIFTHDAPKPTPHSPSHTHTGTKIIQRVNGLPKTVETLCPECKKNILGIEYDENGKVYMEKTCPVHGYFKDLLFSDTKLFLKMERWAFEDDRGLENPMVRKTAQCPSTCGLCGNHQSNTCLGVIDLTNRCNLSCPVCFANANIKGTVYEPSYEEVVKMMQVLRSERPTPAVAVQLSGGEPTLHPRFIDIIKKAKELGFSHIQVATNGIKFADWEFTKACADAGLHQLYLQFDGEDDEVYKKTRGVPLFNKKMQCVENIRKVREKIKIVLVPTIIKTVNDQEVAPIIRFAIRNIDVISGISFQPVAFTGRHSLEEREKYRFTLADMAHLMQDAGIARVDRDFYPLAVVTPFSRLVAAITGDPKITMSAHTHCSMGTYLAVDNDGNPTPFPSFIDAEGLLTEMNALARKARKSRIKLFTKLQALNFMRKYFNSKKAPKGLTFLKFLQSLQGMTDKNLGRGNKGKKNYKFLLVAGMHFMDCYNYDVERVKRCLVHYPSPEGKLYPFCTYNCGPVFRDIVEKKFARL
ncbi:MAG: tetraether lipid synthase Tes [Candidatus Omnitrophota bacterium]